MDVYDLAIVGCGLSALSFLHAGGARGRTVAFEYRDRPGGALQLALPAEGFEDAERLIAAPLPSDPAGRIQAVELRTGATAVGLLPGSPHTLLVRTATGTEQVAARRVLIASGGLEETRESAQIPGSRPAGVVTPVFVHELLALGYLPGKRAVLYGSGRYVAATGHRMAGAGIEVTQIAPNGGSEAALVEVDGFPRLERVTVQQDGKRSELPVDLLVYARGMVANTLWLKGSGVELGPTGAVVVDDAGRTSLPGVFAIGTVVTPSLDHESSIAMGEAAAAAVWDQRTGQLREGL